MLTLREVGMLGGAAVTVVAVGMAASSLAGLVHQRDQLKNQIGALSRRRPPASAPVSPPVSPAPTKPAAPSPSPTSQQAFAAQQMAAALGRASVVVVSPQPTHAPSPRPSSKPRQRPLLSARVDVNAPKIKESP